MINQITEIEISYRPLLSKKGRKKILSSKDAYSIFNSIWNKNLIEYQEQFWLLLLNRANEVIGSRCMFTGGVSGTVVDIKMILGLALKCNATGIIIAHNHPSGNLSPSNADLQLNKKLKSATKQVDIQLIDNLIVTLNGYTSFADEGCL